MQISSFLGGRYLSAADIGDERITVTITAVDSEIVGRDGDEKLCVTFAELDKKLVLNATNIKTLARFGNDTDQWIGRKIALRTVETSYGGEPRMGIRVQPAAAVQPLKRAGSLNDELNDEIPF